MTADDKLARILAVIQVDPGERGLARVPDDNPFTYCAGDFAAACRSIADHPSPAVEIVTGFFIPNSRHGGSAGNFETDGPLGSHFLARALDSLGIPVSVRAELPVLRALQTNPVAGFVPTHRVAVERSGPAAGGEHYTMRGLPTSAHLDPELTRLFTEPHDFVTIGVGDGGNEIGMGNLSHALVTANIPGGAAAHCVVSTDYLIVAGVSNWGAYALAAGVTILRGGTWPADWSDPDAHRAVLAGQVERGPLVDGVRDTFEATVDGLDWGRYCGVLSSIADVVNS